MKKLAIFLALMLVLKVYLIDAPMAVVEDVLPEGMLAWVDSYTQAVYVIDTESLTASKVHWE